MVFITIIQKIMDYTSLTRIDLINLCKQNGVKKYSGRKKSDLILLLKNYVATNNNEVHNEDVLYETSTSDMTFIDLFCGIGGFHQALTRHGMKCVLACDVDKRCMKTYKDNYNIEPFNDIRKLEPEKMPDFDILCGGFSCQPFSNAGKKTTFNHSKGLLFDEITRIAKQKMPKFMFLENVKHILKISDGKVFEYILQQLYNIGYKVQIFELSPHQLGIPQQRIRVIFTCIRSDIYDESININLCIPNCEMNFTKIFETDETIKNKYRIKPEIEQILNAWDEMISIFEVGERLSPTILCHEFYRTYSDDEFTSLPIWKQDYITKNRPIYQKYKTHWDLWYEKHKILLQRREIYGKLEWQAGHKKENDSIFNYFIQLRQSGIRVKNPKYFPTLVAMVQVPIYAKECRYITPRECARLQSFPESFKICENDHQAYKQFGNAVNVDVVDLVMKTTLHAYGYI